MTQSKVYVQYGCGLDAPAGWLNFDGSPRLRIEKLPIFGSAMEMMGKRIFSRDVLYGNIVKGLPVANGTVDFVYASHVLEHLSFSDALVAVKNTHAMLKTGGVFRLIVPDLQVRIQWYLDHRGTERNAANSFIQLCCFGNESRPRSPLKRLRGVLGNSNHLWMYDEETMFDLLRRGGFSEVKRFEMGDRSDATLKAVENQSRFHFGKNRELAVEATKT